MKKIKLIGGFCYLISFFFAASLFLDFYIGLPKSTILFIFLLLGALGFLLNLVSYSKDKTGNPMSNLTYWLGSFFIFAGLVFQILGFPMSISIIIIGSVILFVSIFYLRKVSNKKEDDDVLDQF
jgi:NADH:ubiquinone oxidoreductase subunit 5 (subunit L)/multisubunit Na+/H+ antiporter MnhA subunit